MENQDSDSRTGVIRLPDDDLENGSQEQLSVKEKTGKFLKSKKFHRSMFALIVIDCFIVIIEICYLLLSQSCRRDGHPDTVDDGPIWLQILSYTSMVITTIFLLELPPSLWTFGIDYYLPWSDVEHSTLHLLDAIIIIINFAVLFIQGPAQDVIELLVLLRLWRMVKLLGGVASGVERLNIQLQERLEQTEKQLAVTKQELDDCKRQLQMLQQSANVNSA